MRFLHGAFGFFWKTEGWADFCPIFKKCRLLEPNAHFWPPRQCSNLAPKCTFSDVPCKIGTLKTHFLQNFGPWAQKVAHVRVRCVFLYGAMSVCKNFWYLDTKGSARTGSVCFYTVPCLSLGPLGVPGGSSWEPGELLGCDFYTVPWVSLGALRGLPGRSSLGPGGSSLGPGGSLGVFFVLCPGCHWGPLRGLPGRSSWGPGDPLGCSWVCPGAWVGCWWEAVY